MPIKLNISEKGKAWKLEIPEEVLSGKSVGDKFDGKELKPELEGYELEITGGSDNAGFPLSKDVEGL
jgi:small subunit ribosomal protein S6e